MRNPLAFVAAGWKRIRASVDFSSWFGGGRSAFRGADYNRLSADRWQAVNHPDTEIQYAARALRARARDLVRNDAYAAGAVEAVADNVIGWEGIRCKPAVKDAAGELDEKTNWKIEDAWQDWCDDYATVDGVESWLETERLLVKSWVVDGEVFVRFHRGFDNPHAFAIELLDPDLLDEQYNRPRDGTRNEIAQGVEVDAYGRPLAYHFWTQHPDTVGGQQKREAIAADEIAHFFMRSRAGQTRGYSLFAPILTTVEMGGGALEAELVASRAAAAKMGFITNDGDEAKAAYALRLAQQNAESKEYRPKTHKIAPLLTQELMPGQGFQEFDPTHPNTAFDPFLKIVHRGIARGLSMSYFTYSGDTANANYSSQRIGLVPERDHWKAVQNIVARRLHKPVRRAWFGMATLSGALKLPGGISRDYQKCEYRARRWQWIDPEADIIAAEREVKLGVNSRQRIASDRGLDYELVIDESADDLDYAKRAGVFVGGLDAPPPPKPTNGKNGNGNGAPTSRLAPYLEAPHGE